MALLKEREHIPNRFSYLFQVVKGTNTATIVEFERGRIVTIGGFFGDITEKNLRESEVGEDIKVLVGKEVDETTKMQVDSFVTLRTLDRVVVKRHPSKTASLREDHLSGGQVARYRATRSRCRKALAEADGDGVMDEDVVSTAPPSRKKTKVKADYDLAYRPINNLPMVIKPYIPATDAGNLPCRFECNICGEDIIPVNREPGEDGEQSRLLKGVMRRRMLNCIMQDCISEEKIHAERLESIMDEKERKKEVQGRGG